MTLYRQYRPSTFAELIGQQATSTILQNALARKRLAHAYLFTGSRGTGKTSTARILARAATCEHPVTSESKGHATFEPCNACASCTSQLNDQATDVVEIDAASNRGIEDIRQLREQAQYLPLHLSRKVYIIDEVHMLTPDAFNALLKTLEEPPAHCLFILATTELHKVPATIRSRCQVLRFERGTEETISRKLQSVIDAEKLTVDAHVPGLIARHAQGGYRDAETILEQLVAQLGNKLTSSAVTEALGIPDSTTITSLLDASLSGSLAATRDALSSITVTDQNRAELIVSELISQTRARIREASRNDELLQLTAALTALMEGFVLIKGTPNPKLVVETTCYRIATECQRGIMPEPVENTSMDDVYSQTPPTERDALPSTVVVTLEPVPAEPIAPVVELREVVHKDIRQAWKDVIKKISRESQPLAQMLREAMVFTAEGGIVTVHAKYKFHVEKLAEKKNRAKVESLLHELTGSDWRVEYQLKDSLPHRERPKALSNETAEAASAVFGGAS